MKLPNFQLHYILDSESGIFKIFLKILWRQTDLKSISHYNLIDFENTETSDKRNSFHVSETDLMTYFENQNKF